MSITFMVEGLPDGAPELNVANSNGMLLLNVIGLVPDYCGDIPLEQIAEIRQRILHRRNTSTAPWVRPEVVEQGFISCGADEAYIEQRLTRLDEVLSWAQGRGLGVYWG